MTSRQFLSMRPLGPRYRRYSAAAKNETIAEWRRGNDFKEVRCILERDPDARTKRFAMIQLSYMALHAGKELVQRFNADANRKGSVRSPRKQVNSRS